MSKNEADELKKALLSECELWGGEVPADSFVESLLEHLDGLRQQGLAVTREEALLRARGRTVLHHLLKAPAEYLEYLRKNNLLESILPEISALVGLDQQSRYHMEDAYEHTLNVLGNLPEDASDELILAGLLHDAGKPRTQAWDELKGGYHFYSHESESVSIAEEIFQRLGWMEDDFDRTKVLWMIGAHMRVPLIFGDPSHAAEKIEKVLIKGIPEEYRRDILALAKADFLGAKPRDPAFTQLKLEQYASLTRMVAEAERTAPLREEDESLKGRIKSIWDGERVIRHFNVRGGAVKRLREMGEAYVKGRLLAGDNEITGEEVRDYIAKKESQAGFDEME